MSIVSPTALFQSHQPWVSIAATLAWCLSPWSIEPETHDPLGM